VARVTPYADGLEAVYVEGDPAGKITKGLTWEQLAPHYVEGQGLQFLPNGYTTEPHYRVNESMERGTDNEYRDIFLGPGSSACTKYVCGGMRWDPHLNAVPAYPNE